MERFVISRDDSLYEAWPDLVLTAGGKLICLYTTCVHHRDRSRTQLLIRESWDRGRTWSDPKAFTEETNGMPFWDCARISRLPDNRLAVTCNRMQVHGEVAGEVVLWLGDAEGAQWSAPMTTPARGIVPDKLTVTATGRWLLSAHQPHPVHGGLYQSLWHSQDGGDTWSGPVTVAEQEGLNLCEASLLPLPNGALVAVMRENSGEGRDAYKTVSHDDGLTWSKPVRMPLPGCHRPTAGLLRDGRVLITYRFSQGGKGWLGTWTQNFFAALTDVDSCLAEARNQQWTRILPVDFDRSPASDLGYSGWAQFEDGEIYIAQYIVDDAPNGHIRGYSLRETDFLVEPETGSDPDYVMLAAELGALIEGETDWIANLANASALLFQRLKRLNWAGFYLMKEGQLVLGPFQGKPACIRISLGKGVCGTAAAEQRTLVVPDVHLFPGHIACDAESASEIVVPLMRNGEVLGVLDIDSPFRNRFSEADRLGLEAFANRLMQ
jgi:sialidase-1